MKHTIITISLCFISSFVANGQTNTSTDEVIDLYNRLNEQYGNFYFFKEYDTTFSINDSSWFDSESKLTLKMVKQNKMIKGNLNFDLVKKRIPNARIVTSNEFELLEDPKTVFSKEEHNYIEKLDLFNSAYFDDFQRKDGPSDSLNTIHMLLNESYKDRNFGDRVMRNQKKSFKFKVIYQSEKFYLIAYELDFGHLEHNFLTELIIR